MRHYENREKTKTEKVLVSIACDLCGRTAKSENWNGTLFNFDEVDISVKIHQRSGSHYPDGGSGTEYIVDLCPHCFRDRLIPWLESQGAHVKETDWDW